MNTIAEIKQRLLTLNPQLLEIIDESHLHIGHAGRDPNKGHFRLIIQAETFTALSLVKSHQKIYELLGSMMQDKIHALAIEIRR